jgi:hypothetical protein
MVVAAVPGACARTAGPCGHCTGLHDRWASVGEHRLSTNMWSASNGNDHNGSRGKRNNGLAVL